MMLRTFTTVTLGLVLFAADTRGLADAQTKATDAVPPFKLEYFIGTWSFEWVMPETPLGPSGDVVGTETFQLVPADKLGHPIAGLPRFPPGLLSLPESSKVLESRIEGNGPSGPIKKRAVLVYDTSTKLAVRHEVDSAGDLLTQKGFIGGDFGGIYTFSWEASLKRDGRVVHLKGRRTAFSPHNFRDFLQYSTDGKRFVSLGQPWYKKKTDSQ